MAMLQAKCKNNLHLFSMHNIISHAHHMLLKKEHSYLPKKKTDKINGVAFIMPGSQSTQNLNPKCPALRGWSRKCRALPILNAPNTSEIGLFLPEKIQTGGVEDILFWTPLQYFIFLLYWLLEILNKKLNPWIFYPQVPLCF